MPTYQYNCQNCGHILECLQNIKDEPLVSCPKCKTDSLVRGVGGGIGLRFKGEGFYITDYSDKKPVDTSTKKASSINKTDAS
jgi:putative FmdB family regulatory protein